MTAPALYRALYQSPAAHRRITFAAAPSNALRIAAQFTEKDRVFLLAIEELRPLDRPLFNLS